jgi:ATP-binding cassette subfamily B protein
VSAGPRAGARTLASRAAVTLALAVRAHPAAAAGAGVAAVLAGLNPVVVAWLTKAVLDRLGSGAPTGQVLAPAAGLAAAGLLAVTTPYVTSYLGGQLRRRLQVLTSDQLFRAVAGWPGLGRFEDPAFYDRLRLGQQAGEAAPQQVVATALMTGQNLITIVGFLATLCAMAPALAAVVVLATLPAVRVNLAVSRNRAAAQWWNSPGARRVAFYATLLGGVDAAKEIRLFGLQRHLRERMLAELDEVNETERQADLRGLWGNLGLALLGAAIAGGGIVWIVAGAAAGRFTPGDVAVLVAALAGTQAALTAVVLRLADLHEFLLTFGHFLDLTRAGPGLSVPADPVPVPALRHGIEFRAVWFRYSDTLPWVLTGLDLLIPAGRSVGLVGLNGAGKSTLVKLLCRFYDPDRGQILWDGVDLRAMDPAQLRERVTAVFQDFVRYELTAADNIGLGDLPSLADRERLVAAARAADVHDRLAALPYGYDTTLSRVYVARRATGEVEQGTLLSGGEWQRLALARAAVRERRDLLILDEPSSGLDPEAEHRVHRELHRRRAGTTGVLVSHRLAAIRDADEIVVLAGGRVAERGTHPDLVARDGVYARLFAMQASGYTDPAPVA